MWIKDIIKQRYELYIKKYNQHKSKSDKIHAKIGDLRNFNRKKV